MYFIKEPSNTNRDKMHRLFTETDQDVIYEERNIVKPFLIEQQNDEDNDSDDDENTDNYSNRDADRLSTLWHRQHQTKC